MLAYLFVTERTCASKAMFGIILAVRTEKDACFIKNFVIIPSNVMLMCNTLTILKTKH